MTKPYYDINDVKAFLESITGTEAASGKTTRRNSPIMIRHLEAILGHGNLPSVEHSGSWRCSVDGEPLPPAKLLQQFGEYLIAIGTAAMEHVENQKRRAGKILPDHRLND